MGAQGGLRLAFRLWFRYTGRMRPPYSQVYTTPPSFNGLRMAPLGFRDATQLAGFGALPEPEYETLSNAVTITALAGVAVTGVIVAGIYTLLRNA